MSSTYSYGVDCGNCGTTQTIKIETGTKIDDALKVVLCSYCGCPLKYE